MAHSYTPGLKVSERARITKRRILPIQGDVLVSAGDAVTQDTIVARTELPGDVYPVNVANMLGISAAEVSRAMLKGIGDAIEKGETIALAKSFFGMFKSTAQSPVTGTIESVSAVTGQVIVRGAPLPVQVRAYIPGVVSEIMPGEGVSVDTVGTFIQGIFGVGGEVNGPLRMAAENPDDLLTEDRIVPEMSGCIVVGGAMVTAGAIRKARETGVKAIVTGGLEDGDLRAFLGYDIGVAITGHEKLGITLMVTEGFGNIAMSGRTFDLLKNRDGMAACLNGATQIRAGVIRPEIIVPAQGLARETLPEIRDEGTPTRPGDTIRCIREPWFGRIGVVAALPHALQKMESGTWVRVLEVAFNDGTHAVVPRANVERIEEIVR